MDGHESKGDVSETVNPFPDGHQHGQPLPRSSRHQPARVERIFNLAQIFFFALAYLSSWEVVALNLQAALVNGGPRALAWGTLIVVSGALAQSASLAEMASAQPIAGAQYHWTHAFAPARHRRFITWMQGVITCFAWTSTLAGVANTTAYALQSLAVENYPEYRAEKWHVTLIIFALLVVGGLMNVYAWRLIPWIETLAGILHVILFVIFMVVLTTLAPKHDADFVFATPASYSGWNDKFVSFNLGLMTPSWGFVGFDGAVHLSEEVRKARRAVPSAIFWTVALNGILAYAFALTVLFCLGDLEAAVNAPFPIIEVCMQATGSKRAATAMVSGLLVISFVVTVSSIASASRLTWAWARDGGLPTWFSCVSPRHRVPIRAICLPILVVMCLACLNIGSSTAFSAFISLASLALFTSYAIAIGCMLYARRSREIEGRRWSLGRYGQPINVFALVYMAWMMVIFCFSQYLPVTAVNFNYALPIFAAIVLGAIAFWFARAKTSWSGLDKETIKRVLEDADVELSQ